MDDPTLLIHWLFSCLALAVMFARLVWRKIARQEYNLGDYLTIAACICALTRLGLIHVVLTWGTNNVTPKYRDSHNFTDEEIYRREIGSKLSLVNRVFYNSYLWLQKLVLLDVYRRLILNLRYEKITIWSFSLIFFGTYVACQVTTFSECNPFHLYWQVLPDPGSCSKAQLQLVVVGVLNIVTDFMLLVLPIPLVVSLKTPWQRKIQLYALFTLGIFIIAITVIRLPININNKDLQTNRTTWASTELLTAAIVVNAPTIYGMWNKRRQKKSSGKSTNPSGLHYYGGGTHASTVHRSTVRAQGPEESFAMNSTRRKMGPMEGIMQTKEVGGPLKSFGFTSSLGRFYQVTMAGEDVSVAIAALVIAIVALFAATLQFAQAVFATARGLPNCDERVMGKWSKNSKSKFRWRQLRLEIEFEAPIIFLAPPGNERNPGEGAAWHAEGTIDSCKQTRVDYDKLSPKNDLESVHTVDNELATWVYLLNAIERMEKDSRDWEAEERDKESGQKFMPVGTKPPPVTLTVKIMAKKRSFDTNPAIKKPYAITTISHLVELASVLGIYWKVFDRDDNKYRAEGNGYILTGSRIADFGIVFVFEKTGRTTFGERRLIPTSEVKELCFGRVPTLFRRKKDEAEDVEWQDPLKTSSGKDNVKVEILELGSESEIAETLTQIGCNVETILYYKDKKKHRHIFPVTFELVGMIARVLHIKGRCFRFLPNPTIFPWDRESVSLVRLLSAFSELIGRDLDNIQDTISLMTEDDEQSDDLIQEEVKQIRSMLEEAESLKQDFRTDAALSHTRMTKLHETIEFLDGLIDKRNQAIVLDVLRRHLQVVLKAINGPGQEKNAKDGKGANGSKPASDDISFGDLLGVPLEMREQRFMEIYFDQILWRVIGSTNRSRALPIMGSREQPAALLEGRRIYLGNLLYVVRPVEIEDTLKDNDFGNFEKIVISVDPVNGRNPGYCFVDFVERVDAERALSSLCVDIRGRPVKVGPCEPKKQRQRVWGREAEPNDKRWGNWTGQQEPGAEGTGDSPYEAMGHFDKVVGTDGDGRRLYIGGLTRMIDQQQAQEEMREILAGFNP
ncbi:hypothetical protein K4K61_010644 [Colletotrichum sp. SAR11_59]|nr:hypothetical protein K4K61_010644 [Colletotrichum sp. SAR11_59]